MTATIEGASGALSQARLPWLGATHKRRSNIMSKKQMIEFYMPTRKGGRFPEPFARTTEGEDFLIRSMAETGMTVRKAIRVLRADVKCRKVLVELAKSGYAEYPLSECILH